MNILIIDASSEIRAQIKEVLASQHHILEAESAVDALEQLHQSLQEEYLPPVDLIFLNIDLPYMDGIEACHHIRKHPKLREIPIIMAVSDEYLAKISQAFQEGALDYFHLPLNATELMARLQAASYLKKTITEKQNAVQQLANRDQEIQDIQRQLEEAQQQLRRFSTIDSLTELPNRRSFEIALEKEWKRAQRNEESLALMFIEVDEFEKFNAHYGHPAGNDCLQKIAGILSHYPYRPGDTAARYGGIEFAVLLTNTNETGGAIVAANVRLKVAELNIPHKDSEHGGVITVSMGVAAIQPSSHISPQQLVETARTALQTAKSEGRNQVYIAS